MSGRCSECGTLAWAWRGQEWTLKVALIKLQPSGELVGVCSRAGCSGVVLLPDLTYSGPVKRPLDRARRRLVVRSSVDSRGGSSHD